MRFSNVRRSSAADCLGEKGLNISVEIEKIILGQLAYSSCCLLHALKHAVIAIVLIFAGVPRKILPALIACFLN